jgi:hypothetical protein
MSGEPCVVCGRKRRKVFGRVIRYDGLDLGPICMKCYRHAIDREREVKKT